MSISNIQKYTAKFTELFIEEDCEIFIITETASLTQSNGFVETSIGPHKIGLTSRTRKNPNDVHKNREVGEHQYNFRLDRSLPIEMRTIIVIGGKRFVVRSLGLKRNTGTFIKGIIEIEGAHNNE